MNCPACNQVLEASEALCPFCGTPAPRRDDLVLELTPPPQPRPSAPADRTPAAREPSGRSERPWKEEVHERVHERRRDRGFETDLPLFAPRREPPRVGPPPARAPAEPVVRAAPPPAELRLRPDPPAPPSAPPAGRYADEFEEGDEAGGAHEQEREALTPGSWLLDDPAASGSGSLPAAERPASGLERAQAAAVDVALLASIWGLILYFSAKATRVGFGGLRPSWTVVAGYLVFVALIYAAYFTGVSGRTPGKMALGLRVVDTYGRAPGFFRALFRALLGTLGVLAAGLGLVPMVFDPARRALHDRLFRTRVIRT